MYTVNELPVYLPLPLEHLLVSLGSSRDIINSTLELIQTSFNSNTNRDGPKLLEAIDATYLVSKESGGKVLLFSGSQTVSEQPKFKPTTPIPQDELIYTPTDSKYLSTKGINFTNQHISVDLFVAVEKYVVSHYYNYIEPNYSKSNRRLYKW